MELHPFSKEAVSMPSDQPDCSADVNRPHVTVLPQGRLCLFVAQPNHYLPAVGALDVDVRRIVLSRW